MQFICTKLRKSAELGNELKQKCGEWREAMEKREAQDITSFTTSIMRIESILAHQIYPGREHGDKKKDDFPTGMEGKVVSEIYALV